MSVWYTARGAGLSAMVLLTMAVCLGALASGQGAPAARYVRQYVHRVLAGLGLGALTLHVGTILADSYAHVGVLGAVVPFTSGYRATWVGLGTIAAYLLVLVAVLGAARSRLAASPRAAAAWRSVHALAYVGWALGLWHGWTSGTDTGAGWVRSTYAACAVAGVGALAVRLWTESRPRRLVRHPLPAATYAEVTQ